MTKEEGFKVAKIKDIKYILVDAYREADPDEAEYFGNAIVGFLDNYPDGLHEDFYIRKHILIVSNELHRRYLNINVD